MEIKRENWLIAGIVVFALLLIFIWMGGDKKANAPAGETASTTESGLITATSSLAGGEEGGAGISSGENAGTVIVNDQAASQEVAIERVNLEKPGWVVVRKNNNGSAGSVIGARCFMAGTNNGNMTVPLVGGKSLKAGETYFAELRDDDDDQCVYDVAKEGPILDAAGKQVSVSFKALASSPTATTTPSN